MRRGRLRRWLRTSSLVLAPVALAVGLTSVPAQGDPDPSPAVPHQDGTALISIVVPDQAAVEKLVEMNLDLAEYTKPVRGGIEVHAVLTPAESKELAAQGYHLRDVIADQSDVREVRAERQAVVRADRRFAAQATDTLTLLRADWFTSLDDRTYVSFEVKTSDPSPENILTAEWDSGPGTAPGSGGSATMSRFTDAGEYMYHRFNSPVPSNAVPTEVTITSSQGGTLTAPVTKWLGEERKPPSPHYLSDFVDHYMDPTEVKQRFNDLADEFPELTEVIDLPHLTNGYRRKAQALFGSTDASRFYVTTNAYGSEGGNDVSVEVTAPASPDVPLSVTVDGDAITVELGTDASGAVVSTASDVVAAINGDTDASTLVSAATYRGNDGNGIVETETTTQLTDNLNAPASVERGPFQMQALRIGKHHDGSRTGVFLYCQEHAREWVTPLVCVETAERLLRNYQHDPGTRKLVDDLDIFIVPTINPDGAHYSFYDYNFQRKNMTNYCDDMYSDPLARDAWGVDVNRNFSVGSAFDGYVGASTDNCTSGVFAGPAELSEPEAMNEVWLTEEYPNIRFAMNTHSYGGYFMWPPGAYKMPDRVTLPRPSLGVEEYFWSASSHILSAVQDWRGTAIWPGRTGPVIDVLYSAAGNSADEHWYNRGIIGWDFEVGADLWDAERGRWVGVGFQPPFSEGHEEAMEFASGQIGILEVARAYEKDRLGPRSKLTVVNVEPGSKSFTLTANEPADIYYTLDGSRPTFDSPMVQQAGMREGVAPIEINETTTVKWFAVDIAGNTERHYDPDRRGRTYRQQLVRVR